MVKAVRSQSKLQPIFFSCCKMMPPYFSFHSQAYAKNSSLDRLDLVIPRSLSMATTFASVAIEAWSVPGTQQAFLPCIRARLIKISWMVLFKQ